MNRRAVIVSTVAGLATLAVTITVNGGSTSTYLPLPQPATLAQLPLGGRSAGSATGAGSSGAAVTTTTVEAIRQQTYTTEPPPILDGCTASVSNPQPPQGRTAETVTVSTTPGARLRVEADYSQSKSVHGGVVGSGGTIDVALPFNHAQAGIAVVVSVTANLRGVQRACQTTFTPVATPR